MENFCSGRKKIKSQRQNKNTQRHVRSERSSQGSQGQVSGKGPGLDPCKSKGFNMGESGRSNFEAAETGQCGSSLVVKKGA